MIWRDSIASLIKDKIAWNWVQMKCTTCFCYVLLLENSFYLINIVCLECPKHFMLYHIVVFCFMFFVLFLFSFFSFCFVLLFVLLCFAFDFGKSFYWSHRVWNAQNIFCFVLLCYVVLCFVLFCFAFCFGNQFFYWFQLGPGDIAKKISTI